MGRGDSFVDYRIDQKIQRRVDWDPYRETVLILAAEENHLIPTGPQPPPIEIRVPLDFGETVSVGDWIRITIERLP